MKCLKMKKFLKGKKVVDLNDKKEIKELSSCISTVEDIHKNFVKPIREGIETLSHYEENHSFSLQKIQKIYSQLNIQTDMTPYEMEQSLNRINEDIAILEKKYLIF